VTAFEFYLNLWSKKTEFPELLWALCVILNVAVNNAVQARDTQTD